MSRIGPKSMRGRTTLLSTLTVFFVLILFSGTLVYATQNILANSAREALVSQVDNIENLIDNNVLPSSLTGIGSNLIQVIDADGNVLAASSWATDLPAVDADTLAAGESSSKQDTSINWGGQGNHYNTGTGSSGAGAGSGTGSGVGAGSGMGSGAGAGSGSTSSGSTAAKSAQVASSLTSSQQSEIGLFEGAQVAYAAEANSEFTTGESTEIADSDVFGDDGPYLVYQRGVDSSSGPLTIVAATSLAYTVNAARTVGFVLLCIVPLALLIVALLVWRITGKTLEPIEALRQKAETISITALDQRIEVSPDDAVIGRLTETFNEMLSRLDNSLQEQRRFVSDASHELKSPIAATRIMLDTAREYPGIIETDTLIADLSSENNRLAQIVSDLLLLARYDEGNRRLDLKPSDIDTLIDREVKTLATRSKIFCDTSGVAALTCAVDVDAFSHMLRNLLDNAARYAREGIWITCEQETGYIRLTISDDGIGIPQADWDRVFERFSRLNDDRARSSGGTGLGLAVVRAIALQHGGTARFIHPLHGGASIELTLKSQ